MNPYIKVILNYLIKSRNFLVCESTYGITCDVGGKSGFCCCEVNNLLERSSMESGVLEPLTDEHLDDDENPN